jgi:hypothetical protein
MQIMAGLDGDFGYERSRPKENDQSTENDQNDNRVHQKHETLVLQGHESPKVTNRPYQQHSLDTHSLNNDNNTCGKQSTDPCLLTAVLLVYF